MNPAILNYWQSQQQIGDQMQLLNNNAQSADNAQMSVGANPFDAGIQRAISTARDSLGMTEKQQDRALRRSLLNFAANIAQTPKQKGFFNNFGAISRAALPAISEYDNAEAEAEMANNALANQILNYQKGLRGEEFEREKFNSQAKFQQDQLAETKRYHNLMDKLNQNKVKAGIEKDRLKTGAKSRELNEKKFNERMEKAEDKKLLNEAYSQYIDNIENAKASGLTGKSKLAEWKRYWAKITGESENLDIEEMLRISHADRVKDLGGSNPNIRQFEVAMASAPSITKDPDATIKFLKNIIDKNNEFLDETDYLAEVWGDNYEGQEYSLLKQYRKLQKQNALERNKQEDMGQAGNKLGEPVDAGNKGSAITSDKYIIMVDPNTGEKQPVYYEDVQKGIDLGLVRE